MPLQLSLFFLPGLALFVRLVHFSPSGTGFLGLPLAFLAGFASVSSSSSTAGTVESSCASTGGSVEGMSFLIDFFGFLAGGGEETSTSAGGGLLEDFLPGFLAGVGLSSASATVNTQL